MDVGCEWLAGFDNYCIVYRSAREKPVWFGKAVMALSSVLCNWLMCSVLAPTYVL